MDFLSNPPDWVKKLLPEGAQQWGWWALLGFGGLFALLLLGFVGSKILGLFGRKEEEEEENELEEDLEEIPPAPAGTGDRRLTVEGVPVKLRLVILAPAGTESKLNASSAAKVLDRVVTGLGDFVEQDKPQVRIWPIHYSYEGFANAFHRNTPIPEGEDEPSRWVLVAGRAKVGERQILIGLGLQAIKPTTVGRKTLKTHEWDETFRIKVRE
jgi:hypothetical protein